MRRSYLAEPSPKKKFKILILCCKSQLYSKKQNEITENKYDDLINYAISIYNPNKIPIVVHTTNDLK